MRRVLAPVLVALLAILAPRPAAAQPNPPKPPVPSGPPDKITFVTDFGFNGRHAPYYTAIDKGFFKAVNIETTIERGTGSLDVIRQVAAGNATLGFADMAALVAMRANENVPVKELSIVYTRPPQALFCLPDAGIKTAKDLEGKRLADSAASAIPKVFPAYAKAMGIDASKVKWIFADPTALPSLLASHQVDCVAMFVVGQPLLEKAVGGKRLVRLAYADAPGLDFYGNGLVASDSMIKSNPGLLRRAVWALNQGLAYAFAHPGEAARIMHAHHPEIPVDVARAETLLVKEIALTPETRAHGIGWIDPARVQKTIDIMTPALDLKRKVTVDEVYAPGFVGR